MSYSLRSRTLRSSTSRSSEPRATLTSIPAPGVGTTGKRGLIDTSVAIVLATIDRNSLPATVAVSTLTFAELIVGPHGAKHDLTRARREHQLRYVRASVEPLDFDLRCARAYGPVYEAVLREGRKPRGARAIDVMIAATALAHGLPFYTKISKDLRGLEHLIEIVDVSA